MFDYIIFIASKFTLQIMLIVMYTITYTYTDCHRQIKTLANERPIRFMVKE